MGEKLPENAGEDSFSFLNALLGRECEDFSGAAIVHHSSNGKLAIRLRTWKYIDCQGSGGNLYKTGPDVIRPDDSPGQLYDMEHDEDEQENLHEKYPDVVNQLKDLLEKFKREGCSRY